MVKMENNSIVYLDLDNTAWFHRNDECSIIAEALKIGQVDEFCEQFFQMIEIWNLYFSKKKVTWKETCQLVAKEMPILNMYGISAERFMNVWCDLKTEINEFNPDVLQLLQNLQEKNIKMVVLSDWWKECQIPLLSTWGILEYFEKVHTCDNSYLKCNPLLVPKILKPGQEKRSVIIGDSLRSDIAFANQAGMKSIWLNRHKIANETHYQPTAEVSSLLEIIPMFKK